MKKLLALFPIFALGSVLACPQKPSQMPPDASDAKAEVAAPASCETMCQAFRDKHCPEGSPDAGDSCEDNCAHVVVSGVFEIHPECVNGAKTADDIRRQCKIPCSR